MTGLRESIQATLRAVNSHRWDRDDGRETPYCERCGESRRMVVANRLMCEGQEVPRMKTTVDLNGYELLKLERDIYRHALEEIRDGKWAAPNIAAHNALAAAEVNKRGSSIDRR